MAKIHDLRVDHPDSDRVVVVLDGEHDLSTAAELGSLLAELVDENRVVVVDLSETRFADSTTLNALLQAKATADAHGCLFRIQMGPDALLHRLFEVAGLIDAMNVVATREQALEDPKGPAAT